ncbi:DNA-binding response regulator [Dulcicalothrix desertica PCC 7102]|uniref:DNA-binding response regulator n=1 Tax=Dulcicalothrix desertica PCC 7102 TaxID=232991 RepID=A0A433V635_9CYAN|nr:two-component system response regulator RppA [Dulcicalothrix desertica]RUT01511.1 DNA-binding response regulator [Dulcicalothrix desertica PCC 7102]
MLISQQENFNTTILLVEDDLDFGAAVKRALTQQNYSVDWVTDGAEAWVYLENIQYALAVFDWMLPGVTGLKLCQRLRENNNPLPVLMLTAKDKVEEKVQSLNAGASDYLLKSCSMTELVARLQALQRRFGQCQQTQLTVGNLTLDYNSSTIKSQNQAFERQEISLTHKEFHVLEYLMKHPNQIIAGDEIRAYLQKMNSESCSCVAATQIRALRQKLINSGCTNPIETIPSSSYRFKISPEFHPSMTDCKVSG